jgi:hypothetical protein
MLTSAGAYCELMGDEGARWLCYREHYGEEKRCGDGYGEEAHGESVSGTAQGNRAGSRCGPMGGSCGEAAGEQPEEGGGEEEVREIVPRPRRYHKQVMMQ